MEIVKCIGTGFLEPEEFAKALAIPPQFKAAAAARATGRERSVGKKGKKDD